MTTRELRELLFHLEDQSMTVAELRNMLFKIDDQDTELYPGFGMWRKIEAQHAADNARLAAL